MERLTYDFAPGGNHCWLVKGADNLECREVCERQGDDGCKTCPIAKAFDRLAAIEDILGDRYDLDRLQELVKADRDGRCEIHKVKDGETVYSIFAYVNDLCPKRSNGKPFNPIAQYTVDNFTRNTVDREFGKTVFLSYEAAEAALSDWNGGAV